MFYGTYEPPDRKEINVNGAWRDLLARLWGANARPASRINPPPEPSPENCRIWGFHAFTLRALDDANALYAKDLRRHGIDPARALHPAIRHDELMDDLACDLLPPPLSEEVFDRQLALATLFAKEPERVRADVAKRLDRLREYWLFSSIGRTDDLRVYGDR